MNETTRRLLAGLVLPAVAVAAAAIALAATVESLPDPVATHWNLFGEPDGATSLGPFVVLALVLPALAGLATFVASRRREIVRGELAVPVAIATFVQWLMVGIVIAVTVTNAGADGWGDADELPVAVALVVPAVAVAVAMAANRLVGSIGTPVPSGEPASSVGAAPGERLAWFSDARAGWPIVIGAVVATAGAVALLAADRLIGVLLLAVSAVVASFAVIRVSADNSGVLVRIGPLGWPRVRIPLEQIERAEAIDVRPGRHGGWGYRGSLRLFGRAAVIVRSGDGIQLDLRDGKRFIITADGAATGAGTINDLLAPAAGRGGS